MSDVDIFNDITISDNPNLYIADIKIEVIILSRDFKKKIHTDHIFLHKYPIILKNMTILSNEYSILFFKRIHNSLNLRGDFRRSRFRVLSISNIKFSSKIMHNGEGQVS